MVSVGGEACALLDLPSSTFRRSPKAGRSQHDLRCRGNEERSKRCNADPAALENVLGKIVRCSCWISLRPGFKDAFLFFFK